MLHKPRIWRPWWRAELSNKDVTKVTNIESAPGKARLNTHNVWNRNKVSISSPSTLKKCLCSPVFLCSWSNGSETIGGSGEGIAERVSRLWLWHLLWNRLFFEIFICIILPSFSFPADFVTKAAAVFFQHVGNKPITKAIICLSWYTTYICGRK